MHSSSTVWEYELSQSFATGHCTRLVCTDLAPVFSHTDLVIMSASTFGRLTDAIMKTNPSSQGVFIRKVTVTDFLSEFIEPPQ